MTKLIFSVFLLVIFRATNVQGQIHLSPVNTGDCVCARIQTKRTPFVDDLDRKYCAEHNKNKEQQRKCIENSKSNSHFSFFTDRGSESEFHIGINGKEITLKRITKQPGNPINFIGSFAGRGVSVYIGYVRLISKEYEPGGDSVLDAVYEVDVTVKMGTDTKTFKNVSLWYGM